MADRPGSPPPRAAADPPARSAGPARWAPRRARARCCRAAPAPRAGTRGRSANERGECARSCRAGAPARAEAPPPPSYCCPYRVSYGSLNPPPPPYCCPYRVSYGSLNAAGASDGTRAGEGAPLPTVAPTHVPTVHSLCTLARAKAGDGSGEGGNQGAEQGPREALARRKGALAPRPCAPLAQESQRECTVGTWVGATVGRPR